MCELKLSRAISGALSVLVLRYWFYGIGVVMPVLPHAMLLNAVFTSQVADQG